MERVFSPESPHQRIRLPRTPFRGMVDDKNVGSALIRCAIGLIRQGIDFSRQIRSPRSRHALSAEMGAVARGLRLIPASAWAYSRRDLAPWHWVDAWARKFPHQRALADDSAELTWVELHDRAQALGIRLQRHGVTAGMPVLLFCNNSNFLVVALLAIQWAGGCPVLLNASSDTHLLSEAIENSGAAFVLVDRNIDVGLLQLSLSIPIVAESSENRPEIHCGCGRQVRHKTTARDTFAVLLTSGTTGQPKSFNVSNFRAVTSGLGMGSACLDLESRDSIYCVLPLSHATGLLTGLCAALMTGCALIMTHRFSASEFWPDVVRKRATHIIYVGEVARQLLTAPVCVQEGQHGVKCLYGTGMSLYVWHRFQARFRIPKIVEYYGATELSLAMVNLAGAPGFMGRIALRHVSPWQIMRRDEATGELLCGQNGAREPCSDFERGELLFLGAYRTGDIVVRDEQGYVALVNRRHGFFRQKGHNVSTQFIERSLRDVPGVQALGVTHITLPRYEGQAGLVVAVPGVGFQLAYLERAYKQLPEHARPRFLRLAAKLCVNRGLKFDATEYGSAGVNPESVTEPLYAYGRAGFMAVDSDIWQQLQLGTYRF